MTTTKILHIIPWHCLGGASRAMIALAKYSSRLGHFQHRLVSLLPAVPQANEMALQAGMTVAETPNQNSLVKEIEDADIVHVNFWNSPQMYEFLRSQLPPMRLLMWFHVAGDHPPQILTKELVEYADCAVACSPYTYEHAVFRQLPAEVRVRKTGMVYGATDFARLAGLQPKPHTTFNVGYLGAASFAKMHRNFIPMSASINIPNVRFIFCGGGAIDYVSKQAQQFGILEKIEFYGFTENIKSVIEMFDVYGYPLPEDTYAASELNLQEVMYGGVPPVVFPYGGVKRLVVDNYTGLIVHSEIEYKQAIEHLYHHPEERARLGRNAQEYARQIFGGENAAKQINPIYQRILQLPKRKHLWGISTASTLLEQSLSLQDLMGGGELSEETSKAQWFINSLGGKVPELTVSMTSQNVQELFEADRNIATYSLLLHGGEGGIFQYHSYYPNDGYLALWAGLGFQHYGQHIEAISRFIRAIDCGCNHWRVAWYLAQSAEQLKDWELMEKGLRSVVQVEPSFAPAQEKLNSLWATTQSSPSTLPSSSPSAKKVNQVSLQVVQSTVIQLLQSHRTQEAIRMLEEQLNRQPIHAPSCNDLGVLLCQTAERRQEAIQYLQRAVALSPQEEVFRQNLEKVYAVQVHPR